MIPDRKIEILSPAGSYAAFRAALRAGADAVYAGGNRFGARAYAQNFTEDELIEAIQEAHLYGRKLYLTVNTLLKEQEICSLHDYLAPFYESGLDAVIVQDLGVVEYIRTHFPGLDIHASTQMTVTGPYGARFAQSQGITRVVPARELSLEEIREIRSGTGLEIECFVHGALCYCYSGQCLMSSMIGGRSGNRGQCAQPCRLPYTFDRENRYYLSPKDICTLEIIPDLIDAGIDSFKIEGRMKKPEYVALVTQMYRRYTDLYLEKGRDGFSVRPADREMLMDLYNRGGSSCGYYKMRNGSGMLSLDRPNHAGVPAAAVQYQKGREVHASALTDLQAGDVLEIAGKKSSYTLGNAVAKDEKFTFLVQKGVRLKKERVLYRIRNASLLQRIDEDIIGKKLQQGARARLFLTAGSPALLHVSCRGAEYEAVSEEIVQEAQNRPMNSERIRAQLLKTGNSEFYFEELSIHIEGEIFLPVGQLNQLRRTALEGLKEKIQTLYDRKSSPIPDLPETHSGRAVCGGIDPAASTKRPPAISVSVETPEQLLETASCISEKRVAADRIYINCELLSLFENPERQNAVYEAVHNLKRNGTEAPEIIAALPHVFRQTEESYMEQVLAQILGLPFDGVLIRSLDEFEFLREHGFDKKMILDHNLYVFNKYTKRFWNESGVSEFTAPLELNQKELRCLGIEDCELEIYGHAPVMVSAQCLFRTTGRCRKDCGLSFLTDRYENRFPVRAYCLSCYNVIYNDLPLSLMDEAHTVRQMLPESVRIRFSVESPEQVRQVLETADDTFGRGRADHRERTDDSGGAVFHNKKYTHGHFRKGVL